MLSLGIDVSVRRGLDLVWLDEDRRVARQEARVTLEALAGRGVQSLLVEGGSSVHGAFIAARLVDEVAIFFAPRLLGGGVPMAGGVGFPLAHGLTLGPPRVRKIGSDILLSADVLEQGHR